MLANSNILGNPYFIALNLIDTVNNMIGNNIPVYIDRKRDLGLFIYSDSPISSLKEETALYRLTQKTTYGEMAIKNKFENIAILTGSKALETMISVCIFGDICFYRAKIIASIMPPFIKVGHLRYIQQIKMTLHGLRKNMVI